MRCRTPSRRVPSSGRSTTIDGGNLVTLDGGNATRGYQFDDLHESCKQGTPFYMMYRTLPKIVGSMKKP